MNEEDHAIVIGVRRYERLGRTSNDPAPPLNGPDRDAQAIYDWLTDPAKGGVPPENARLIRSQDYPDPFEPPLAENAKPQADEINDALQRFADMAEEQGQKRVGRRLYLYASGHGFSNDSAECALIMANATQRNVSRNHVTLSQWAKWFAATNHFDQVVLWMDCCMNKYNGVYMLPGGNDTSVQVDSGGKVFAAFAARFPKSALEHKFPNGEWQGIFTYHLLQALEVAGTEGETTKITTAGIVKYVRTAMSEFMAKHYPDASDVSETPGFANQDDIEFRDLSEVPTFPVVLSLPENAVGHTLEIVTGNPLRTVDTRQVTSTNETINGPFGQYFARVQEIGWLQDFRIIGGNGVPPGA